MKRPPAAAHRHACSGPMASLAPGPLVDFGFAMYDIRWIRENAAAFDQGLANRSAEPLSAVAARHRRPPPGRHPDARSPRRSAATRSPRRSAQAMAAKDDGPRRGAEGRGRGAQGRAAGAEPRRRRPWRSSTRRSPRSPTRRWPTCPSARTSTAMSSAPARRAAHSATMSFTPKQHFEIGEALGMMDFETAAKLSGARFIVLQGPAGAAGAGARPVHARPAHERARLHGSEPAAAGARRGHVSAPAQLPKFEEDLFGRHGLLARTAIGDQLSATADPDRRKCRSPISCASEILDEEALPLRLTALHAVLPRRGGLGRPRHARHDPPAPVHQGRAGLHHHARAGAWPSTSA